MMKSYVDAYYIRHKVGTRKTYIPISIIQQWITIAVDDIIITEMFSICVRISSICSTYRPRGTMGKMLIPQFYASNEIILRMCAPICRDMHQPYSIDTENMPLKFVGNKGLARKQACLSHVRRVSPRISYQSRPVHCPISRTLLTQST